MTEGMTWDDLNTRQQAYLTAIFDQDQENERNEQSQWSRGGRPRPAIEWRWMFYGLRPDLGIESPLRARLRATHQIDEGTGSTFEALAERGLILVQYRCNGHETFLQITPAGKPFHFGGWLLRFFRLALLPSEDPPCMQRDIQQ